MSNKKFFFCQAPWTHTYVDPSGIRKVCCLSKESDSSKQPLSQFWNSQLLRDIRLSFLNNKIPKQCAECLRPNKTPYYDTFNDLIGDHMVIRNSTDATGKTSLAPCSFDYRTSNLCNLKCRMCGDLYSSSWEIEHLAQGIPLPKKPEKEYYDMLEAELISALIDKKVQKVFWSGGEPLLHKIHWQFMQKAIELNLAKEIDCQYTTNLGTLTGFNKHIFHDVLSFFKTSEVAVSMDGSGEAAQYIRSGIQWSTWTKNLTELSRLMNKQKNMSLNITVTLTIPGLVSLKDLIIFALQNNVRVVLHLIYSDIPKNFTLSPLSLPKNIFYSILDDLIAFLFKNLNPYTIDSFQFLMELRKKKLFEELPEYQPTLQIGKRALLDLESTRSNDSTLAKIFSKSPELLDWWENI